MSAALSVEAVRQALSARPGQRLPDQVRSRAAVAMILRPAEAGLELLLIRRAEHPRDPWSGQMAFPGGRAEPGDADLSTTATREVAEEIGIDLRHAGELLGPLDELRAMARLRPMDLTIQPFVFRLTEGVTAVAKEEVESVHWLPLEALFAPAARSSLDYRYEGQSLVFPCLRHEGLVIWGLTYRMLQGLQERLQGEPAPTGGV